MLRRLEDRLQPVHPPVRRGVRRRFRARRWRRGRHERNRPDLPPRGRALGDDNGPVVAWSRIAELVHGAVRAPEDADVEGASCSCRAAKSASSTPSVTAPLSSPIRTRTCTAVSSPGMKTSSIDGGCGIAAANQIEPASKSRDTPSKGGRAAGSDPGQDPLSSGNWSSRHSIGWVGDSAISFSRPRSSTRRILPEIVLGSS